MQLVLQRSLRSALQCTVLGGSVTSRRAPVASRPFPALHPVASSVASRRVPRCIPSPCRALRPVASSVASRRVPRCIPSPCRVRLRNGPAKACQISLAFMIQNDCFLASEAPGRGRLFPSCVYDSKRLFFQPPELRGEGSSFPIGVQAPFPSSSPLSITETLVFKLKAPEGRRPSPPPWVFRDPPWVFSDITTWQALP